MRGVSVVVKIEVSISPVSDHDESLGHLSTLALGGLVGV
jgi:hypothetical protein